MKVNIKSYIRNYEKSFKKYKNVEKLKIIDVAETSLNPNKQFKKEKRYVCQNQNGKLIEKSDFMLEYGYLKNNKGIYTPIDNRKVIAMLVPSKIEFSGSQGESYKLRKGDYVVISSSNIFGMKKEEFDENFVLDVKIKNDEKTM